MVLVPVEKVIDGPELGDLLGVVYRSYLEDSLGRVKDEAVDARVRERDVGVAVRF